MWNQQRYCWQLQNHVWITNFRGRNWKKLPYSQNTRISSWSYDMVGHAKKCVERYCELANKTTQQLYKVSTPCIGDHHFKEEELKSVGELSSVCSQIVLKCLYLARIGRPDIPWSVNKLARSITKMDQGLWQTIISFDLLHPSHMWIQTVLLCGKLCQTVQIGTVFQDSDFAGDLEDSKSTSGGLLCIFGSQTFVPISWSARNRLSVFRQFYRSWNHFSRCRFTHGRYSPSHLSGIWWLKYFIPKRSKQKDPRESYGETRQQSSSQTFITPSQSSTPTSFKQTLGHIPSNTKNYGPSALFVQVETSSDESFYWRRVPPPHRVRLHLKARGCR